MKLLLLLLLAQQQVSIVPVTRGALLLADGGVVDVNGGVWFSDAEVIAMGKDHAGLRKQNEYLQEHAADAPYKWVLISLGAGLVIGSVTGYFAARAVPR